MTAAEDGKTHLLGDAPGHHDGHVFALALPSHVRTQIRIHLSSHQSGYRVIRDRHMSKIRDTRMKEKRRNIHIEDVGESGWGKRTDRERRVRRQYCTGRGIPSALRGPVSSTCSTPPPTLGPTPPPSCSLAPPAGWCVSRCERDIGEDGCERVGQSGG